MNKQPRNRGDFLRVVHEPAQVAGRPPPHDLDAEGAVLSACMLSKDAMDRVLDILRPEHFYSDPNARIYEAMAVLVRAGSPVDLLTVKSWLSDKGRLAQIGGPTYLTQLVDATPAIHNVAAHADRVRDLARLRGVIATAQRISAEGYSPDAMETIEVFCDGAATAMGEAAAVGIRSRAVTMSVAMADAVSKAAEMANSPGTVYGFPSGIRAVDDQTGGCVVPGELTVIKGKSGEGKSSYSRQMLVTVANSPEPDPEHEGRHIWTAGLLSTLEMKKHEVATYSACCFGGVDSRRLRTKSRDDLGNLVSNMTFEDWQAYHSTANWIGELPIFIEDDRKRTLGQLRAELRVLRSALTRGIVCPKCRDGKRCKARLGLLVVDTLQLLAKNEPKIHRDEEDSDIIDRVVRSLGDTAVDFNIAVVALSQVNSTGAAYGSPGAIRAHAQTVLDVKYSKKKTNGARTANDTRAQHEATVTVDKCRAGWEGAVPLWYVPAFTRFEE